MLWSNRFTVAGVLLLAFVFVVGLSVDLSALDPRAYEFRFGHDKAFAHCEGLGGDSVTIDCIYDVVRTELEAKDMRSAMLAFAHAYDNFYEFASTGCHRHAHRVGDMVYYGEYLEQAKGIEEIDFPQETTACGYGFFHGFIEHLIQDEPYSERVTEICTHLHEKYGAEMGDIRLTCYHGSGHGFLLAHVENVPEKDWGDIHPFIERPVEQCYELTEANDNEVEECLEGVFNVVVDWMEDEEFGFTYNTADPFSVCRSVEEDLWRACYYEMAQKISMITNSEVGPIIEFVEAAPTESLGDTILWVGVAGIIQGRVADGNGYDETLEACLSVPEKWQSRCVGSVVGGLFEHGSPQVEYKFALEMCGDGRLERPLLRDVCYQKVADRLQRFYTQGRIEEICTEFPDAFREKCIAKINVENT